MQLLRNAVIVFLLLTLMLEAMKYYGMFCIFIGMFRGGIEVLVRAKLVLSDGVNLHLTVRSTDEYIAELITASVG